jgi:hypothetical protein
MMYPHVDEEPVQFRVSWTEWEILDLISQIFLHFLGPEFRFDFIIVVSNQITM